MQKLPSLRETLRHIVDYALYISCISLNIINRVIYDHSQITLGYKTEVGSGEFQSMHVLKCSIKYGTKLSLRLMPIQSEI